MQLQFKLPQHIEHGRSLTAKCLKVNPDGKLLFQDVDSTSKTYTLHPDVVRAHLAKKQRAANDKVSENESECGSRRLTRTEREKRDVLACLKDIAARRAKDRAEEREEAEADKE